MESKYGIHLLFLTLLCQILSNEEGNPSNKKEGLKGKHMVPL